MFVVFVFTFNNFENYLAAQLYRKPKEISKANKVIKRAGSSGQSILLDKGLENSQDHMDASKTSSIKDFCREWLPRRCLCRLFRKTKMEELFEKARQMQKQEMEITTMIRMIRINCTVTRELVRGQNPEVRKRLN